MRRDLRLSRTLHALLHMAQMDDPMTSDTIAQMLGTPAPAVRRMMAGLRQQGIVTSMKGHGGGWKLTRALCDITMLDIYEALDAPQLFATGPSAEPTTCLVERAVDLRLGGAFERAAQALRADMQATTLDMIAADFSRDLAAQTTRG